MIVISDSEYYFKLQNRFEKIPYTQSRGWYSYVSQLGKKIVFFVDSEQNTNIACWGVENKIPMTKKKILKIFSECYQPNISEQEIKNFYNKLIHLGYQGIEIESNSYYDIKFEIGLKLAGYKRPLGIFSSNLSIEVDLERKFNFDNNWKGNIRKGFKNQLYATEIKKFDEAIFTQIFQIFDEMANFLGLNYHNKNALKAFILSNDMRTFVVYDSENIPLAVNIIHVNKPYANFVYAANALEIRKRYGSHFLVNYVMKKLKDEKFNFFDLCRIPVSKGPKNGIYLFKKGTRGNKIQYIGEWCYYKSPFIEGLSFVHKILFQKKKRS